MSPTMTGDYASDYHPSDYATMPRLALCGPGFAAAPAPAAPPHHAPGRITGGSPRVPSWSS